MLDRVARSFLILSTITVCFLATTSLMAADEKTPQSQGLSAAPAAPTAITLNWTAPGDDSLSGTASQYDVRYSTSLITAANFATASQATGETAPKAPGQSETFTVTGLTPGTLYYFAIKTSDEAGNWSAISNVVSASTTDNVPPASIKNLTAN